VRAFSIWFLATMCLTAALPAVAVGTEVRVDGSRLVIDAPGTAANVIDVRLIGFSYVIDEQTREGIRAGDGCGNLGPQRAVCGAMVMSVDVFGQGGGDWIGLHDVTVPVAIDGGDGDDLLETGAGRDRLVGGRGEDALVSTGGADELEGDEGDDLLVGGDDADEITAGDGNDILEAGKSAGDVLSGGAGRDLLKGARDGGARISGGADADYLIARGGDNELEPGGGPNTILGVDPNTDMLECSSIDRARARQGGAVRSCGAVPRSRSVPGKWPLRSRRGSAAALPDPHPIVKARPRVRGQATYYTVRYKARVSRKKRICLRFYNQAEHRVERFSKKVKTKHPTTYHSPGIRSSSYYGRPLKGKC
jgi:Ca2+-binding RTX toxin-like protein